MGERLAASSKQQERSKFVRFHASGFKVSRREATVPGGLVGDNGDLARGPG